MDNKTLIKLIKIVGGHKTYLPALNSVLLKDGKLTISDLDVFLTIKTNFKAITGLVDYKDFCDALASIDNAIVSQTNKDKLQVKSEDSSETIMLGLDKNVGEFPVHGEEKFKPAGTIKEDILKMIVRAGTFTAYDELRPALMHVHIKDYVVGTDALSFAIFANSFQASAEVNNIDSLTAAISAGVLYIKIAPGTYTMPSTTLALPSGCVLEGSGID